MRIAADTAPLAAAHRHASSGARPVHRAADADAFVAELIATYATLPALEMTVKAAGLEW